MVDTMVNVCLKVLHKQQVNLYLTTRITIALSKDINILVISFKEKNIKIYVTFHTLFYVK